MIESTLSLGLFQWLKSILAARRGLIIPIPFFQMKHLQRQFHHRLRVGFCPASNTQQVLQLVQGLRPMVSTCLLHWRMTICKASKADGRCVYAGDPAHSKSIPRLHRESIPRASFPTFFVWEAGMKIEKYAGCRESDEDHQKMWQQHGQVRVGNHVGQGFWPCINYGVHRGISFMQRRCCTVSFVAWVSVIRWFSYLSWLDLTNIRVCPSRDVGKLLSSLASWCSCVHGFKSISAIPSARNVLSLLCQERFNQFQWS